MGEGMGPAARMQGTELSGGWTVGEPIAGTQALCYEVTGADGKQAFLKAVDFSRAFNFPDFPRAIEEIASAFRHERDLITHCTQKRLTRVVRGLDQGEVMLPGSELPVMYIVFELAEGDVRQHLHAPDRNEGVWRLQVLHQSAIGLAQLHRQSVFHTNFEPAHVLIDQAGAKVGGLSRANHRGVPAPLSDERMPSDRAHAAPECLYGFELADVAERRRSHDAYMYGSLILYLYEEVSATTALLCKIPREWHPSAARASFEEVLPHLALAFDEIVEGLRESATVPARMVQCFRELCAPDPRERGHPRSRAAAHTSQFSLERYVTQAALALREAQIEGGEAGLAA